MISSATYGISLTAIAIVTGLAVLPVFGRFSDQAAISLAKRKIRAALYAFRLFGDEPRLVFRAQGQLLLWNARYLGLVLRPTAIVVLPILFLLLQMDVIYGHRALHVGEPAVVTARMADGFNLNTTSPQLTSHDVAVETPAVRIPKSHRVFWRVAAMSDGRDGLSLNITQTDGKIDTLHKNIQAGYGLHYLSQRRVASFLDWFRWPAEGRLPRNSQVRWIGVQYPDAEFNLFGFGIPWIVWFGIVSWITVFALRKRFGVII